MHPGEGTNFLGLPFVSLAGVGVCSAKGVSVQQGEPHLPSLASRRSKVWPYVPESCRRHLLRERAPDCHRQAGQRYMSHMLKLSSAVLEEALESI